MTTDDQLIARLFTITSEHASATIEAIAARRLASDSGLSLAEAAREISESVKEHPRDRN